MFMVPDLARFPTFPIGYRVLCSFVLIIRNYISMSKEYLWLFLYFLDAVMFRLVVDFARLEIHPPPDKLFLTFIMLYPYLPVPFK